LTCAIEDRRDGLSRIRVRRRPSNIGVLLAFRRAAEHKCPPQNLLTALD
jgi:hypothetical protein